MSRTRCREIDIRSAAAMRRINRTASGGVKEYARQRRKHPHLIILIMHVGLHAAGAVQQLQRRAGNEVPRLPGFISGTGRMMATAPTRMRRAGRTAEHWEDRDSDD